MIKFTSLFILIVSFLFIMPLQADEIKVSSLIFQITGFSDKDRNDKNEEVACTFFKPTQQEVIDFFNISRTDVDKDKLIHERYSPYKSAGLITFENGSSGEWVLQSSGVGRIFFDSTKEIIYFFHKENKWTDPYVCTYELGDDPIC